MAKRLTRRRWREIFAEVKQAAQQRHELFEQVFFTPLPTVESLLLESEPQRLPGKLTVSTDQIGQAVEDLHTGGKSLTVARDLIAARYGKTGAAVAQAHRRWRRKRQGR